MTSNPSTSLLDLGEPKGSGPGPRLRASLPSFPPALARVEVPRDERGARCTGGRETRDDFNPSPASLLSRPRDWEVFWSGSPGGSQPLRTGGRDGCRRGGPSAPGLRKGVSRPNRENLTNFFFFFSTSIAWDGLLWLP